MLQMSDVADLLDAKLSCFPLSLIGGDPVNLPGLWNCFRTLSKGRLLYLTLVSFMFLVWLGTQSICFLKEWSFFLLTLDSNVNIWQLLNSFQLWSKQPLQFSYSCLKGNIFLTMQLLFIKIFWQGRLDFGEQKTLTSHSCLWFECPLSSTQLWCVQNSHRA